MAQKPKKTRKKSTKIPITPVDIPSRVLIAGRYWLLKPATNEIIKEFQEILDEERGGSDGMKLIDAAGSCFPWLKTIVFKGVQHKEELLDTLLHEGIHAILAEYSDNAMYAALCQNEDFVDMMSREILNYLKQISTVELNRKQ
jgi:hypothetical protein